MKQNDDIEHKVLKPEIFFKMVSKIVMNVALMMVVCSTAMAENSRPDTLDKGKGDSLYVITKKGDKYWYAYDDVVNDNWKGLQLKNGTTYKWQDLIAYSLGYRKKEVFGFVEWRIINKSRYYKSVSGKINIYEFQVSSYGQRINDDPRKLRTTVTYYIQKGEMAEPIEVPKASGKGEEVYQLMADSQTVKAFMDLTPTRYLDPKEVIKAAQLYNQQ